MLLPPLPALVLSTMVAARSLPPSPSPVSPFAALDVVKLAVATPGVLAEQGLTCTQGPPLRLGAETGCLVLERMKSGRLSSGVWALILPLQNGRGVVFGALVYDWTQGQPQYAGFLGAPAGLRAKFKNGSIVAKTPDGQTMNYTVAQGKLQRL